VETRDKFIEQNRLWADPASGLMVSSPWFDDFTSVDHHAMQKRIEAMRLIVRDPDLQKRDDIRGLIDYLDERKRFQEKMAKMRVRTLDSKRARMLLGEWERISLRLRERNLGFARIWARYLSTDDVLAM
jgi:hypothetical protein